ncbi:hypothetical protein KKF34_04725 [Myxococcota bacterium]|nr:hypothetical protein [Myxococcota bacterium]MBU1379461.1 hypothetical protein [Myxococcota bacterium]MBU1496164.1 hypothetical protein [Myxococcota bacterium]
MKFKVLIVLTFLLTSACDDSQTTNNCGDNILDPGEECDGTAIPVSCRDITGKYEGEISCNSDCTLNTSQCTGGFCGDNKIEPFYGEKCEGENLLDNTCETRGYSTGILSCTSDCQFDTSLCEDFLCGNGNLDEYEDCEGTVPEGLDCEDLGYYGGGPITVCANCRYDVDHCIPWGKCGDLEIQTAYFEDCEALDLGGQTCESLGHRGGALRCKEDCHFDTSLCEGFCGDGTIQETLETCDGTNFGGETCESMGYNPGVLACVDCAFDFSGCNGQCGDNNIDAPDEDCDGTNLDEQSCESLGQTYGGTLACQDNCSFDTSGCLGSCGDGILQESLEECDPLIIHTETCATFGHIHGPDLVCDSCNWSECNIFTSVTTGELHACGLLNTGKVMCWGNNSVGQLGTGNLNSSHVPAPVAGTDTFTQIEAGYAHTCGITSAGELKCWGSNADGQLGQEASGVYNSPVAVNSGLDFDLVSAGGNHTCARHSLSPNMMSCWGQNTNGQLGIGTTTTTWEPTTLSPFTSADIQKISAGWLHTCVLLTNGQAYCWGYNGDYQLGNGNNTNQPSPAAVYSNPAMTFSDISAGELHTCAINSSDSKVYCWGESLSAQCGLLIPHINHPDNAFAVSASGTFVSVTAGKDHTCATTGTTAYCWGSNEYGQLGNGSASFGFLAPQEVIDINRENGDLISAGSYYNCLIRPSGNIYCWGWDAEGKLGNGTSGDASVPSPVSAF